MKLLSFGFKFLGIYMFILAAEGMGILTGEPSTQPSGKPSGQPSSEPSIQPFAKPLNSA